MALVRVDKSFKNVLSNDAYKSASLSSFKEGEEKNVGGLLGGVGYLGEKVAVGAVSSIEGISDYVIGGVAKFFGFDKFAERQFANDWFGDWYSHPDEWFNPGEGWKIAGDVAGGIGTSLPAMAVGFATAGAGTIAMGFATGVTAGLGAAGNATKEAYRETGKLTGKEFAYGALTGAVEGGMETVTNIIGFGTGAVIKSVSKSLGNNVAKVAVRDGLTMTLAKSFIGEAFEEGVAEILSGPIKRKTYDKDAKNATWEEVAYSSIIGGLSGLVMGGAGTVFSTTKNTINGNKLVNEGKQGEVLSLSKDIINTAKEKGMDAEYYAQISDTYNKLQKSIEKTGGEISNAYQKRLLGELNIDNVTSKIMPQIYKEAATVVGNPELVAKRLASYNYKDANGNAMRYTKEQLLEGVDLKNLKKTLPEALKTNEALRNVTLSSFANKMLIDASAFAESTMRGEKLAGEADLDNFLKVATEEDVRGVEEALGIKAGLRNVSAEYLNERVRAYEESGNLDKAYEIYRDIANGTAQAASTVQTTAQTVIENTAAPINMGVDTELKVETASNKNVDAEVTHNNTQTPTVDIKENSELARRIKNSAKSKYDVIRDFLIEKFYGQEFTLTDGKKAIMDKRDAKELSHKSNAGRTTQLANLKSIVENAIYSHSTAATHKKFSEFYYYAVDVKCGKDVFNLWINVGVAKNDGSNHIYSVTNRKEAPTNYGVSRPKGNAIQNASSNNIISKNSEIVKENSKKTIDGDKKALPDGEKTFSGKKNTQNTEKEPNVNLQNSLDKESGIRYAKSTRKFSFQHENFPQENEVQSEAHRLAVWWSYNEAREVGDQTLISMNGRWYLVEKFDDATCGYQVEDRISKAEYTQIYEEINKNGRSGNIRSIQGRIDRNGEFYQSGNSVERRTSSSDSVETKHSEENSKILSVDSGKYEGREVERYGGRSSEGGSQSKQNLTLSENNKKALPRKEETIDNDSGVRYAKSSTSKTIKYISHSKIGYENVEYIKRQLLKLYSGLDNCIGNGIAIAKDDTIYIVDSSKHNKKMDGDVAVRKVITISDGKLRAEHIRSINNDAISNGYVSDELSSRIGVERDNNSGSIGRLEAGEELSANKGQSQNNEGRVSSDNGDRGVQVLTSDKRAIPGDENSRADKSETTERKSMTVVESAKFAQENVPEYNNMGGSDQARVRRLIRQMKANGFTDRQMRYYARVASRSGIDIVVDKEILCYTDKEGKTRYADGLYSPSRNKIYVNPDGSRSPARLLIHELTHAIYKDTSGRIILEKGVKNLTEDEKQRIAKKYFGDGKIDIAEYTDELNAHYTEALLDDDALLEKLCDKNPTLKDKILSFFKKTITGYSDEPTLSKEAKKLYKRYKTLFDSFSARNEYNVGAEKNEGGERFALIGRTEDGRGIYRSNYPKNTPKDVKQKDIINLIQNVWSKKPIKLNLIADGKTVPIEAKFNPELTSRSDLSKIAFGNRKGTNSEKRITLDLSSDLYQIAEESLHVGSKSETGKYNPAHLGVSEWHYFLTNLVFVEADGTNVDCYMNIDVKQNDSGHWFYSFAIEKGTAPRTLLAGVTEESATVPNNSISQNTEKSTENAKNVSTNSGDRMAMPDEDIDNFDFSQYNEVSISSNEYSRIESEVLTWDSKNKNQIRRRTLSNGTTYRYTIDDDNIVHVIGSEESKNIHDLGEKYDNKNTKRLDRFIEGLRVKQRRRSSGSGAVENGREQTENDRSNNSEIRQQGDSDRSGYTENRRYVDRGVEARIQESPVKIVHTFKDVSGKTKSIIKIGSEYYIKDNHKAQPAKSIEQAIENENKRVIIRYAKKYDITAGMARRRLEENSNFLIEERKKGARFAISETDTDTVDTSDSVGKKRRQYNASIKERIFTAADSIYIDTVDEMYGAKKYLSKVGKIKNADDIIQAVRASMSASQTMLGDVQYDIFSDDGKKVGEGLSKIMKPISLKGDTVKISFNEYLMHWRNVDSMTLEERTEGKIPNKSIFGENENRSEAVTAEQSRKRIDEIEKVHPDFKKIAEKVWAYTKNLNHMRVEAGLISADSEAYMNELYPHYVPAYRDTQGGGIAAIKGKRNIAISSTVKKAKGSGLDILDVGDSIAAQTQEMIRAGRINQLFQEMYNIAESGVGTEYVDIVSHEKVSRDQVASDLTGEQISESIELRPKNNQITGFVDGKKVTLQVSDKIFIAFENMSKPTIDPTSALGQGAKKLNDFYKKLLTSWSPIFTIRNSIRDFQDAGLNTKHPVLFYKNFAKAYKLMFENSEQWQLYRAYGGYSASIFGPEGFSANVDSRGFEAMAKIFESDAVTVKTVYETAKRSGKNIFVGINNVNAFVEQATRFAEFLASVEAGDSIPTAINNAAEVTTNFGRRGRLTKKLNATVMPFLNPAIQGFDKVFRNVGDAFKAGNGTAVAKAFATLFGKAAVIGLAPMLVNMLLYGDDEEYEKLRETDKENNFLIKVGDTFIKIPRGRVASIIGGALNRTMKIAGGEDPDVKDYLSNVLNQVTPVQNLTRTIASPFFDVKNNLTWYGTAIEGREFENTAPKDRYGENTSSIAIAIGKGINYSPKKIHYLLDQYSGVIGDFVLPMTTNKAEKDFLSGNFTIDPATSNKLSTNFYKMYDKAQYAKTAGDDTATYQVRYLNKVKKAISEMYDEKSDIQNSNLSGAEKLQQTRVVQILINEAYKTAMTDFEVFTKAIEATAGIDDEDLRYTEAIRIVYGSERALSEYNSTVYEKCQTLNLAGIDYDSLYYYYFSTKDLESDKDKNGNTISGSKRKKVLAEINKLRLKSEQKLILLASKGYSLTDAEKNRVLRYIMGLKISKEQKSVLAELCGFEVKNGSIIMKSAS